MSTAKGRGEGESRLYSAAPPARRTGGVVCAMEHASVMKGDFDEVCLLLCESGYMEELALEKGVPVWSSCFVFHGLRRGGAWTFLRHVGEVVQSRWRYFRKLRRLLREKPGVLHIHSRAAHTPYALLAGWLARVPVVVTIHEPGGTGNEAWLDHWMIRLFAGRVVFLTNTMRNQYPAFMRRRSTVVPNHFPLPDWSLAPSLRSPPLIAILARMGPQKGCDVFLQVILRLKERGLVFKVEIAGGWSSESVRRESMAFLEAHGLAERVEDRGLVEDVDSLYRRMDVLLLPSRRDSFPRVVMEAMCHGLPVVASRVDGLPEMIQEGVTGFLVEPEQVEGFADAMERLLKDSGLRRRMGQAGRERARDLFSPDAYRRSMLAVYADLEAGR